MAGRLHLSLSVVGDVARATASCARTVPVSIAVLTFRSVTSSPTKAGLAHKAREFVVGLSELVLAAAPLLPEFDPDSHLDGPIEAALSWLLQVKAQLQPEAGALVEQSFPIGT